MFDYSCVDAILGILSDKAGDAGMMRTSLFNDFFVSVELTVVARKRHAPILTADSSSKLARDTSSAQLSDATPS